MMVSKNMKNEEYLEHRKKKRWVDEKSGNCGFFIYPRSLFITWGNSKHWDWKCFKETSEENIKVAKLSHVCWLDIRGKFKVSDLSAGVKYEIAYEIKLTKGSFGWELPVQFRLTIPGGQSPQVRTISLLQKPRGIWFEVKVGSFETKKEEENGENDEVCFDIMGRGGHWKHGLVIKGAIIRPLS